MKKAVLKPPVDFSLTNIDEPFKIALQGCLESFPDAKFYYNLPLFPQTDVVPALIITSDTVDSELFVNVIQSFANTTNFDILPKVEAFRYLSRISLEKFN